MSKISVVKNTTSLIIQIFVQDSSSTTGAGLDGLAHDSAGLTCYYKRNTGSASVSITLTGTGTLGTFTSGLFKEIDSTNMVGWYELHVPNSALVSGAKSVGIHLQGAANMVPLPMEIEITGIDNQDSVRGGMTALPNATAGASGGLPTGDSSGYVTLSAKTHTGAVIPNVTTTGVVSNLSINESTGGVAADIVSINGQTISESTPDVNVVSLSAEGETSITNACIIALEGTAVQLDLTQNVPLSNTAHSVGDALNAARAQGFGKWLIDGTTLLLYANDGTTIVRSFTLDSPTSPTQRV